MTSKTTVATIDEVQARIAEREAAEKAKADRLKAEREKEQARLAAEFDRRHKSAARAAYLATGGSEAEFERAWPEMRERIRQSEVDRAMARRRAGVAHLYRNF